MVRVFEGWEEKFVSCSRDALLRFYVPLTMGLMHASRVESRELLDVGNHRGGTYYSSTDEVLEYTNTLSTSYKQVLQYK